MIAAVDVFLQQQATKSTESELAEEAVRFLKIIRQPSEVVEIRCLPKSGKSVFSGWFDDMEAAGKRATAIMGFKGVYFTLNPVRHATQLTIVQVSANCTDDDVTRRRWLLIDIEGDRQDTKGNASADEVVYAIRAASTIAETVKEASPLQVMSGNGCHLLYRIDLPSDAASRDLVKKALKGLAARYNGNGAKIDTTVFNAGRISKLPGTLTRKGKSTEERPCRYARVLDWGVSGQLDPATLEEWANYAQGEELAQAPLQQDSPWQCATDAKERARLWLAKREPAVEGKNGDEWTFKTAAAMVKGFGLSDGDALNLMVTDWNPTCSPPWSLEELQGKLANARKYSDMPDGHMLSVRPTASKGDGGSAGVVVPKSAVIDPKSLTFARVHRENLVLINTDYPPVTVLNTALRAVNPPGRVPYLVNGPAGLSAVLEHSRRLVTIATAAEVSARLQDRLGFLKLTKNKETGGITGRQVSPPKALCETALALKSEELGLPQVSFCSEVPKVAQDLSLITKPGYHSKQRALYLPDPSLTLPDIPETPTVEQVKVARSLIVEVFQDFPFITNSCRANAVALMIAPFVREATGISPLFLTWAPSRGTGKSLMVECAMIPFLGAIDQHDIPDNLALVNEFSEEHADRELASALLQSPDVAWLDNFNNRLASGIFAKLLTAGFYDHRILGTSDRRKMRNSPVWIATANAPRMSDEIARRVCYIGLDAKSERPEERTGFLYADIKGWCVENRARLIEAILILVQHWIACGRPKGSTTFGSFQRWADVLGGILACAGITGFMENRREQLERSDDETEEWKTFTGGWWEKFGPDRVTCGELIELVRKTHLPSFVFGRPNEQSQIVCLGKSLNQKVGRIFGGFAIERGGVIRGSTRYNLASLAEDAPVKPDAVSMDFPEEEVLTV